MLTAWYSGSVLLGRRLSVHMVQLIRSEVYGLALLGDIEGLRSFYVKGRASVNQAHPFDGASALIVSIHWYYYRRMDDADLEFIAVCSRKLSARRSTLPT